MIAKSREFVRNYRLQESKVLCWKPILIHTIIRVTGCLVPDKVAYGISTAVSARVVWTLVYDLWVENFVRFLGVTFVGILRFDEISHFIHIIKFLPIKVVLQLELLCISYSPSHCVERIST